MSEMSTEGALSSSNDVLEPGSKVHASDTCCNASLKAPTVTSDWAWKQADDAGSLQASALTFGSQRVDSDSIRAAPGAAGVVPSGPLISVWFPIIEGELSLAYKWKVVVNYAAPIAFDEAVVRVPARAVLGCWSFAGNSSKQRLLRLAVNPSIVDIELKMPPLLGLPPSADSEILDDTTNAAMSSELRLEIERAKSHEILLDHTADDVRDAFAFFLKAAKDSKKRQRVNAVERERMAKRARPAAARTDEASQPNVVSPAPLGAVCDEAAEIEALANRKDKEEAGAESDELELV